MTPVVSFTAIDIAPTRRFRRKGAFALILAAAALAVVPAKAQSWPTLGSFDAPVEQVRGGRNLAIIAGATAGIIALGAAASAANRHSGHGYYGGHGYGHGGYGYGAPVYAEPGYAHGGYYEEEPVYAPAPVYRHHGRGGNSWLYRSN